MGFPHKAYVTTCYRLYGKANGKGIWAIKLLSSDLEISSLGQNWTKSETSEVNENLVIDERFDYEFDHMSG